MKLKRRFALLLAAAVAVGAVPQTSAFSAENGEEIQTSVWEEAGVDEGICADAAWEDEILDESFSGADTSVWEEPAEELSGGTVPEGGLRTEEPQVEIVSEEVVEEMPLLEDGTGELKTAPEVTASKVSSGFYDFLSIAVSEAGYVAGVTSVSVDDAAWGSVSSQISLYGSGKYYLNADGNQIYFDGSGSGVLKTGNIIRITNPDYQELILKVTGEGGEFAVKPYDPVSGGDKEGPSDGVNTLHIRLVGAFESALCGQQKYDSISGASTSVSTNKNSDVTVQAAVLPDGQEPEEDDWKNLCDAGVTVNAEKTFVSMDTANSGMVGVYSPYDSSLTLAGTPKNPGEYPVSVSVTDENGRTAVSNELVFKVYSADEKLIDHLKLENCVQTADGKYMYDMEPWAMVNFGGNNETVTVPKDIKAWYGSHTSGTYGELGYAVSGDPVQTLIVPEGCDLTLVNMKLFSSVKIVVENGGRVNLRDSSLHGQIEVEDGGILSINYDNYSGEFLTGSSVNGQVILNGGAVLENSIIYSNTNYLANGSEARHNTSPVVVFRGDAAVRGEVYIRGDEASSGTDPSTGKSYCGQPALGVENGTLTIPEGSVLAVYGGGKDATTSVGGTALILDNAQITGGGTLIAVGGSGTFDDGGCGVSGSGSISTGTAYLEGGAAFLPKDSTVTAGKAAADTVVISDETKKKLVDGSLVTDGSGSISAAYWLDITRRPDLSVYTVTDEAEEETEKDTEGQVETEAHTHNWDEGQVTTEATCGAAGVKTYACSSCKETKTEPIPATGNHSWDEGQATVEATVTDAGARTYTCKNCGAIKTEPIAKLEPTIELNTASIRLQVKQSTKCVKVSGLAAGDEVVSWKSSNKKIVKVNKNGKITAQNKTGNAKITVTLASGKEAVIKVKVQKPKVATKKISGLPKSMTLKAGEKEKLDPVIRPLTSQDKVTYASSNKKVAAVTKKGVLSAKKAGKARITVKSGKKKFVIAVTVE